MLMRSYSSVNLNALWFLITANVLIFIVEMIVGGYPIRGDNQVIRFLGLTPVLLWHQPWTMITSMFVHAGFWHILCNMISLYFLGSFVLRLVGEGKFLTTYFLGGIAGNILFYIFLRHSGIPGIGASGAIFALGGALAMMTPKVPVFIFFIPIPVPLWIAIIVFLVISFIPGVAWQAHLGGLLLGLIAGYFFRRKRRTYYF